MITAFADITKGKICIPLCRYKTEKTELRIWDEGERRRDRVRSDGEMGGMKPVRYVLRGIERKPREGEMKERRKKRRKENTRERQGFTNLEENEPKIVYKPHTLRNDTHALV